MAIGVSGFLVPLKLRAPLRGASLPSAIIRLYLPCSLTLLTSGASISRGGPASQKPRRQGIIAIRKFFGAHARILLKSLQKRPDRFIGGLVRLRREPKMSFLTPDSSG